MSFNSSQLLEVWCFNLKFFKASRNTSPYYQVTLTTCVVTSLLAPMAVVANYFILIAIWKNKSLRTPSYVILAGLSFTDFCTGLLSQPFYVVYKLADIAGNLKMFCLAGAVAESVAVFLASLKFVVMAITAVERWLHMSRRSLLTVRRLVIFHIASAAFLVITVAAHMYEKEMSPAVSTVMSVIRLWGLTVGVIATAFSYFKVFRILRRHQCLVQTNENAIDIAKYRKSIFTILYIFAIFVLSYIPYLCCILVFLAMQHYGTSLSSMTAFNACAVILFSSSFFNPLLYYWRIKEIRDSVKNIVRKLSCKKSGD